MQTFEIEKECRICLDTHNNSRLISPCSCKGTNKWVHEECLKKWRLLNINKDPFYKCSVCKKDYVFKINKSIEKFIYYMPSILISNLFLLFIIFPLVVLLDLNFKYVCLNIISIGTANLNSNTYLKNYFNYKINIYYIYLISFIIYNILNLLYYYSSYYFYIKNKKIFKNHNLIIFIKNFLCCFIIYISYFISIQANNFYFFLLPSLSVTFIIPFNIYYMYKISNEIIKKNNINIEVLSFEENPLINMIQNDMV